MIEVLCHQERVNDAGCYLVSFKIKSVLNKVENNLTWSVTIHSPRDYPTIVLSNIAG